MQSKQSSGLGSHKSEKFKHQDVKGSYDIDGVSFDGKEITVAGDRVDDKNISSPKNIKDPHKLDRMKNLDSESTSEEKLKVIERVNKKL